MSAVILRRIMRFIRSVLLAALAICMLSAGTPAHARSSFWPQFRFWGGDHHFRHKHQHKQTKSDLTKKPQSQDAPKGPLQIIISIADQRISLYENGALIARSSVSTGVERHPTPLGVFSVLSKKKWHRSNIYSAAPDENSFCSNGRDCSGRRRALRMRDREVGPERAPRLRTLRCGL